jgi:hypothetical protein
MLRIFITAFLIFIFGKFCYCQKNSFLNPTGSYEFNGKTVKKGGETFGYFGNAKVLLLDSQRIVVKFYICKGAPSYNSGSFLDTLAYERNSAVYRGDVEVDSTCRLSFKFFPTKMFVKLYSVNPNFACGFGHAVDAYGYFRRVSNRPPSSADLVIEE